MKYGFFIFILAFLLSTTAYVLFRGAQALVISPFWRNFYITAVIISFLSLFGGMILGNYMPLTVAKTVSFIGYSFLFVLIYLLFAFLAVDIFLLLNKLLKVLKGDVSVFRFWTFIVSSAVILILAVIGYIQFNHPKVVKLDIQASKPMQNKTLKIVSVSDVHLGISIDKGRLKKYVQMINAQKPDLVLIAGDLIDRSIQPVIKQKMEEELLQIHAPLGKYAVYGNHEYFGEGPKYIAPFFAKSGITLLPDSAALIRNEFYIAGRKDKIDPSRKELSRILSTADTSKPIILMDHQPYHLSDAEKNGVDLQISGHTHKGQFFPGNLFVKRMFELGYGYLQKGNTHYYVSSGLGLWGPQFRIGTQSEIVVINFSY